MLPIIFVNMFIGEKDVILDISTFNKSILFNTNKKAKNVLNYDHQNVSNDFANHSTIGDGSEVMSTSIILNLNSQGNDNKVNSY